jgi:hypothetical protein
MLRQAAGGNLPKGHAWNRSLTSVFVGHAVRLLSLAARGSPSQGSSESMKIRSKPIETRLIYVTDFH